MRRSFLLLILFAPLFSYSQKGNTHNLFWLRLSIADSITDKLGWEVSLQKRRQNNYSGDPNMFHSFQFESYSLLFQYSLSKNVQISASPVGFFRSHPLNTVPNDIERPSVKEFRWTVRLDHEMNMRYFNCTNRYSVEYRWRDVQNSGDFNGNWRVRHMARLDKSVPGILSKPVTFTFYNEVFFQFGHVVSKNYTVFDQDRIYVGAAYEIFRNTTFNLGYQYGFQIRSSGSEYDNINTCCFGLTFDNLISQLSRSKVL